MSIETLEPVHRTKLFTNLCPAFAEFPCLWFVFIVGSVNTRLKILNMNI